MHEAQEIFDTEFDPLPAPEFPETAALHGVAASWCVDFDLPHQERAPEPPAVERSQAFTLWLRTRDFEAHREEAGELIECLLAENRHSTLQVVLEPLDNPRSVTPDLLEALLRSCFRSTSYLDRFYSVLPGRTKGAKRLVVLLPRSVRDDLGLDWIDAIGDYADIVWQGADAATDSVAADEWEAHEYVLADDTAVGHASA
jgi:hypothetical protein